MKSNNQDFGFGGDEFLGEVRTTPYCQFLNSSNDKYGLAVTSQNAELAEFELTKSWKSTEHEFTDGTTETLFLTQKPRLLVLNRGKPMMSNDTETISYDRLKCNTEGYKPFSYAIVWLLDQNNKPISTLPFRLKCSGYSGWTFLKHYGYHNNPESFCKQFLAVYKSLTSDRAIDKNDIFYAHAVFELNLARKKVTSSHNGQSNFAVVTDSFTQPTKTNFASLIIKNGSPVSSQIKQMIDTTQSWLVNSVTDSEDSSPDLEANSQTPLPVA